MALARSRQAARRVKDRWKAKNWYKIQAPLAFNQAPLGETMADDAAKLAGRRVEVTMQELTGDMRMMHVKLFFRVNEVLDTTAKTEFVGHTMTSDYVRRLTRRGHTKIPAVFDLRTKDGSRIRVKPFAVSDRRCQTTQAQAIRQAMNTILDDAAKNHSLSSFLKEVLVGDLSNRMYKEARKIHPVRRVEIAKTEVLQKPAVEMDETPIIVDEPEPVEGEAVEGEETAAEASEESEGDESEGDELAEEAGEDETEGPGVGDADMAEEIAGDSEE